MRSLCSLAVCILLCIQTVVLAQTLQTELALLPRCSSNCISSAATSIGCGATDYACQCGNTTAIVGGTGLGESSACLLNSCGRLIAKDAAFVFNRVCEIVHGLSSLTSISSSSVIQTSIISSSLAIPPTSTSTSSVTHSTSTRGSSVIHSTSIGSSSVIHSTSISSSSTIHSTTASYPVARLTPMTTSISISTLNQSSTLVTSTSSTTQQTLVVSPTVLTLPTQQNNNDKLSPAARAGIAITISAMSLLVTGFIMLLLRRRGRLSKSLREVPLAHGHKRYHSDASQITSEEVELPTRINIHRQVSVVSSHRRARGDHQEPEDRPQVPRKDFDNSSSHNSVSPAEMEHDHEAGLQRIRDSLMSVEVVEEFETGTKIQIISPQASRGLRESLISSSDESDVKSLGPVPISPAPTTRTAHTFGRPQSTASTAPISEHDAPVPVPSTTKDFFGAFPHPPRYSDAAGSRLTRASHLSTVTEMMPSTSRFSVSDTGTSSSTHLSLPLSITTEAVPFSITTELVPLTLTTESMPLVANEPSPLNQNPFTPGDANFKAANDYFALSRTLSKNQK
ncbi:hypothetical protein BP6252_02548 [Coleophoma cylindrospora]|uniref:CFEM domain-containing protein n=1 Tax=Coleophoma cylindrospora TaxID=1849047 RepID=A0A3D8SGS3_9HELO|nr:hypothetical protein BP6252_02548 [Coleophoma cylindrospora]